MEELRAATLDRLSTVRIGVVADTHCPEFIDRLPAQLPKVLAGVELILHAGDIGGPGGEDTLAELARIAPVEAVRGDHDRGLDLPASRVVEVAGRRIGLVHGNRARAIEEPATFVGTVSLGHIWPTVGIRAWLVRRFPDADVVVYGHTHAADVRRIGKTLVFNPGAVYQVTPEAARARLEGRPGWFEWSWLQVMRRRRRWPAPTVGLLEVRDRGITASILPL